MAIRYTSQYNNRQKEKQPAQNVVGETWQLFNKEDELQTKEDYDIFLIFEIETKQPSERSEDRTNRAASSRTLMSFLDIENTDSPGYKQMMLKCTAIGKDEIYYH